MACPTIPIRQLGVHIRLLAKGPNWQSDAIVMSSVARPFAKSGLAVRQAELKRTGNVEILAWAAASILMLFLVVRLFFWL